MNRSSPRKLEFRGVQLDLARQPENLEYIFSFIDFAARHDYNYLVLYLEGRVRTKSFPYLSESESYSEQEIRSIVDYASGKGLETVPVVSLFGHADLFLRCPELEHLAELRDDRVGRFSRSKHVFCPSLPETCEFLENYLSEVSALFFSEYFHAGFDEAWDIGYCDLCLQRLQNETQSDLFLNHLLNCYEIVTKKLSKRMLIWDDLFDIYPEALGEAPRDIILCAWHYDKLVDLPAGHCGGPKKDQFAEYDKLGFEYIFAPASVSIRNVETFSTYALGINPLGALLTVWELERRFLFSDYPTIAYAGLLWNGENADGGARELQERAIREVVGNEPKEHILALKAYLNTQDIELSPNRQDYLRGPLSDEEYAHKFLVDIAGAALGFYASTPENQTLAHAVLRDTAIDIEIESLHFELRELIPLLYARSDLNLESRVENCIDRIEDVRLRRCVQWNKHRDGIAPRHTDAYLDAAIAMLRGAVEDAKKSQALLRVSFGIGQACVDFSLRYQGSADWEKVVAGFSKSLPVEVEYWFPLYSEELPEAVRIESWGYVGVGIRYLEIETPTGRLGPALLGHVSGAVYNPQVLLEHGRDACYLGEGEQAARQKFRKPSLAEKRNVVELILQPKEF